jgi:hypothetical protein
MGQTAPSGGRRWSAASAALAVAVGGSVLSGCSGSVAAATTTLRGALAASIVRADGSVVPGRDGAALHDGDVVRTGAGGRAELVTRGRIAYVGSDAAVAVIDGARQQLRHGAMVVDAEHGPGLRLSVASLNVSVPAGAATRAERMVTVRVGALDGTAHVRNSAGRALDVTALHQILVAGDALPDATTPLQLTDDDGEAHAVPALVRDDETLNSLAAGIDATGRSTATTVHAALVADHWSTALVAPPGAGRAERLLPAIIAAAGPASQRVQRYDDVRALRAEGGSWGVIVRLVGVRSASVLATFAAFERTQPPGRVGTVAAVLAGAGPGAPTAAPSRGAGGGGSGAGGGGGSGPGGHSPSPSPSPGSSVVGGVQKTVQQVLALVPVPTPTRTAIPLPRVSQARVSLLPTPTPAP